MCSFSRSVFHQTPKHCRSSAFLWGTIHISRSVNHDLAQNDAEDAPPPVLDTGGLDVDVPGGSDVKCMIIDMQLHGGPGEQLPGLAWLGFVCFTILANKPANSVKFPSTQAVPGRQWNVQIQSQPRPGKQRPAPPCRERHAFNFRNFIWKYEIQLVYSVPSYWREAWGWHQHQSLHIVLVQCDSIDCANDNHFTNNLCLCMLW